jgi:alkyldihydroxyacetonephosphate synthase
MVSFTGTKYLYSGKELPEFFPWAMREVRLDIKNQKLKQTDMEVDPPKNLSHEFLNELINEKSFSRLSFEKWERIMHSHGASLREVFALRYGRFERYVDLVVYPTSTLHIQKIIELADKYNVMIVPYGGGTNVT